MDTAQQIIRAHLARNQQTYSPEVALNKTYAQHQNQTLPLEVDLGSEDYKTGATNPISGFSQGLNNIRLAMTAGERRLENEQSAKVKQEKEAYDRLFNQRKLDLERLNSDRSYDLGLRTSAYQAKQAQLIDFQIEENRVKRQTELNTNKQKVQMHKDMEQIYQAQQANNELIATGIDPSSGAIPGLSYIKEGATAGDFILNDTILKDPNMPQYVKDNFKEYSKHFRSRPDTYELVKQLDRKYAEAQLTNAATNNRYDDFNSMPSAEELLKAKFKQTKQQEHDRDVQLAEVKRAHELEVAQLLKQNDIELNPLSIPESFFDSTLTDIKEDPIDSVLSTIYGKESTEKKKEAGAELRALWTKFQQQDHFKTYRDRFRLNERELMYSFAHLAKDFWDRDPDGMGYMGEVVADNDNPNNPIGLRASYEGNYLAQLSGLFEGIMVKDGEWEDGVATRHDLFIPYVQQAIKRRNLYNKKFSLDRKFNAINRKINSDFTSKGLNRLVNAPIVNKLASP